jgi:hypothetical protein
MVPCFRLGTKNTGMERGRFPLSLLRYLLEMPSGTATLTNIWWTRIVSLWTHHKIITFVNQFMETFIYHLFSQNFFLLVNRMRTHRSTWMTSTLPRLWRLWAWSDWRQTWCGEGWSVGATCRRERSACSQSRGWFLTTFHPNFSPRAKDRERAANEKGVVWHAKKKNNI